MQSTETTAAECLKSNKKLESCCYVTNGRWCHSLWFHRPDLWVGAGGGATGQTLHLTGYGTDVGVSHHLSITDRHRQTLKLNEWLNVLKPTGGVFFHSDLCIFTNDCLPVDNRKRFSMLCVFGTEMHPNSPLMFFLVTVGEWSLGRCSSNLCLLHQNQKCLFSVTISFTFSSSIKLWAGYEGSGILICIFN